MKKLIILSLTFSFMFILSCSDEKNGSLTQDINGTHLAIDDIIAYLPNELRLEKKVSYKDEFDNSTTLSVNFEEHTVSAQLGDNQYTSDKAEISIYNPDDLNFLITLLPSANYSDGNKIVRSLGVVFMPGNPSGSIIGSIQFDERGHPERGLLDDFRENIELNDKSFKDCFVLKNNMASSYSEIYLNSEVGIAAYRDGENKLWVFDKFIE